MRHSAAETDGKTWPSTAATMSGSRSGASPVTPNVPSLRKRPARPAIWRDLLRIEPTRAPAVELAQAGEGDMVDVHVEPHADRVGRDQEVDLAGLEQFDLRVAGAGDSEPITTAAPPRWRRISSAMA